jgi:uncharacterized membrane protein YkoI
MTQSRFLATLTLALALAAGAAVPGDAAAGGRDRWRERGDDAAYAERSITLDEAVAQAERRYNARAIRAEEKRRGDRIEYHIRLLGADGRVFEVTIDAGAGKRED